MPRLLAADIITARAHGLDHITITNLRAHQTNALRRQQSFKP